VGESPIKYIHIPAPQDSKKAITEMFKALMTSADLEKRNKMHVWRNTVCHHLFASGESNDKVTSFMGFSHNTTQDIYAQGSVVHEVFHLHNWTMNNAAAYNPVDTVFDDERGACTVQSCGFLHYRIARIATNLTRACTRRRWLQNQCAAKSEGLFLPWPPGPARRADQRGDDNRQ
jgi:hypothetical protein